MVRSARQALAIARGEMAPARVHTPDMIRTRGLRHRDGLSQAEFAKAYGIDLRTLQDWEQGRTVPAGPARTLLRVIEANPKAVREAVAAERKDCKSGRGKPAQRRAQAHG